MKHESLLISILILWFGSIFFLICYQLAKYQICKKRLMMISEIPDERTSQIISHCSNIVFSKPRNNLKILMSSFIESPFTIGLFHPVVFLPKSSTDTDNSFYLLHELNHINNSDIFWKFIAFFIILIHWYNPLTYLLFYELCNASEKNCDEDVIHPLNEHEKTAYGALIIKSAQHKTNTSILFADTFIKNKKQMKERILFMTRKQNRFAYHHTVTAMITCLIILSTPISVLAYQPVTTTETENYELEFHSDDAYFVPEGMEDPFLDSPYLKFDFGVSDEIFIDESGTYYKIPTPPDDKSSSTCSHSYINGTKSYHEQEGAGCRITTYNAKCCTKCGYLVNGKLASQITYTTCPH